MHQRPHQPYLPNCEVVNPYNNSPYGNSPYNNFNNGDVINPYANPYNSTLNNGDVINPYSNSPYSNWNQYNNQYGNNPYGNWNQYNNPYGGNPHNNRHTYRPAPPCTSFAIPHNQFGANGYGDGVNMGVPFAGNANEGGAVWGNRNPMGANMGGAGWATDAYGRMHGNGSMTFVAPDGSVGTATLHSANGQGELDWRSSTGSGVVKWGPGYYNSYTVPVTPYMPQRQSW
jgi:hypothetical protein